jgi:16S rRNA G966 N2-methylase RsmD
MRVFGGQLAGLELLSPGERVRPSMERLRDACARFFEGRLVGLRVVDLFAGTGALGLELLSNGAASCDFIENGTSAMHSLKANTASARARLKKIALAAAREEVRLLAVEASKPATSRSKAPASASPVVEPPAPTKPFKDPIRVFFKDAIPFVEALSPYAYDIAVCDPPYGSKKLERVLATWHAKPFARWLALEHAPLHVIDTQHRLVHRSRVEDSVLSILEQPPAQT